jgi:hypothetical protein
MHRDLSIQRIIRRNKLSNLKLDNPGLKDRTFSRILGNEKGLIDEPLFLNPLLTTSPSSQSPPFSKEEPHGTEACSTKQLLPS